MKSFKAFGLLLLLVTAFATRANAAPYASHFLFTAETTPHQHVHLNWTMGCSLFSPYAYTSSGSNSWGFPYCNVQAPNGAGIFEFGIDFLATSYAHITGSSATSPDNQNSNMAWFYTGAELRGTGATVLHQNASGRILYDLLSINYNFWYRATVGGAKTSVFANSPGQSSKYGLP